MAVEISGELGERPSAEGSPAHGPSATTGGPASVAAGWMDDAVPCGDEAINGGPAGMRPAPTWIDALEVDACLRFWR